ncbi:MAG: hypothetical protein A3F91_08105 [Flavobacteria bacterium RIFCSPLOWO2_12_FULL_35_11]|nr:MAG: hypothetical protein A3F91_08105 [Flavobacteria bacterium RIFCSPLOWO2_12_FULL_35_11]
MEFRRYWEILVRWKWVFFQSVLLTFVIALFLVCFSKPIYKTSAKVMINSKNFQAGFIGSLPIESGALAYAEARNVPDTFISIFKTSPIISKIIKDFDLRDSKGNIIDFKDFTLSIFKTPILIFRQKKGVKIKQIGSSETLEIIGYSDNRDQAVNLTNAVANAFIDFLGNAYRQEATTARYILEEQLLDVYKRLRLAKNAEERYKIKNNATNITSQSNGLVNLLYDLKTQRANAERFLKESTSQLNSIKKKLNTVPEFYKGEESFEANPNIIDNKNELRRLNVQLVSNLTELTPEHPDVKALLAQIDALGKIIKEELLKTFSSETIVRNPYYGTLIERYSDMEIDIVTYSVRKEVLDNIISKNYKELKDIAKKQRKLDDLTSEVGILNDRYRVIKTAIESAKVAEKTNTANAVIIQPATPSQYEKKDVFFPKKKKGLTAALVLGSMFGFFLVFLLEYVNDKITSEKDLILAISLPVLRTIPKIRKRFLKGKPPPEFIDHFWNIKTHLDLSFKKKETARVIVTTSTNRGEGKTLLCRYLTSVLAEAGQEVLLVDSNLRNPQIHKLFGFSNSVGLVDYLGDKKPLQEVILPTNYERLKIIPSGPVFYNPLKIINPVKLSELIQKVKAEFDYIFFDTPAIIDGNDALIISHCADIVLFVVASGYVSDNELQKTLKAIQKINPSFIGTIFNKAIVI